MSHHGSDGWEHVNPPDGKGQGQFEEYSPQQWAQWSQYQMERMQAMAAQLTQQQNALAASQQQATALQAAAAAAPTIAQQAPVASVFAHPPAAPAIAPDAQMMQQFQLLQQSLTPPPKVRKVDTPVLPDPNKGFRIFERAVDEHVAANDGQSDYAMAKSLKDALPEHLGVLASERFSIDEMKAVGSLGRIMDWLRDRFDDLPDDTVTQTVTEWHNFRRTGNDLRAYVDQFEHHLVRLTKVGQKVSAEDQKLYLLLKADLPTAIEHEMRTALFRVSKALGQQTYEYKDLKSELILLSRRPELLQRRVNVVQSDSNFDNSKYDGRVSQDVGNVSRSLKHVNFGQKGKGKGNGKGSCWHYQAGTCLYGSECRFSHGGSAWIGAGADSGRGRSRTPRGQSDHRGRDSSRSPRQFDRSRSPRGDNRELCRLFQTGFCNFGNSCKFSHAGGRGGRSRSPSKGKGKGKGKHGKSRSRSPSWPTRSPSGRGAPDRSPRPPPKR